MARLTIDLEPLMGLSDSTNFVKVLVKNGIACDIAGADGIAISTGDEYDIARRKAMLTLSECLDISMAVKAIVNDQWIDALQEIKPAIVIFDYAKQPLEQLAQAITNLQVANILVGVTITLDLDQIKSAAKMKSDFLVLNCAPFCDSKSFGAQIDALNKVETATALAQRLSIGVIASGRFDLNNLGRIRGNKVIEEYIVGHPFHSYALLSGFNKAVESYKYILR